MNIFKSILLGLNELLLHISTALKAIFIGFYTLIKAIIIALNNFVLYIYKQILLGIKFIKLFIIKTIKTLLNIYLIFEKNLTLFFLYILKISFYFRYASILILILWSAYIYDETYAYITLFIMLVSIPFGWKKSKKEEQELPKWISSIMQKLYRPLKYAIRAFLLLSSTLLTIYLNYNTIKDYFSQLIPPKIIIYDMNYTKQTLFNGSTCEDTNQSIDNLRCNDANWTDCLLLSEIYYHGLFNIEKNDTKYLKYRLKFSNATSIYLHNHGLPMNSESVQYVIPKNLKTTYPKAFSATCYNTGKKYILGKEVEKNDTKSFYFIKKSCDSGFDKACSRLGLFYINGTGCKKDEEKGYSLINRTYQFNKIFTTNTIRLGLLHEKGIYIDKNITKAIQYYQEACDKKNYHGCSALANIYLKNAKLFNVNDDIIINLYEKSCNQGIVESCERLGNGLKDKTKAIKYKKLGCYLNQNTPCKKIIDKNKTFETRKFYQQLCEDTSPIACYELGQMIYDSNETYSKELYEKSCDLNLSHACYASGILTNSNLNKKIQFYKKSCDLNFAQGCYELARIYKNNKSLNIDSKQYYKKACSLGDVYSCDDAYR